LGRQQVTRQVELGQSAAEGGERAGREFGGPTRIATFVQKTQKAPFLN